MPLKRSSRSLTQASRRHSKLGQAIFDELLARNVRPGEVPRGGCRHWNEAIDPAASACEF